jgi:SAM-dependent methyltransferase
MSLYPDFFAKYYDRIYHHLRDGVDNRFYLDMVEKAGGRVLEVGSGTGRFFLDALEQGADIYGIDISPAMLDVLRAKLPAEQLSRVSEQGITDFRFDRPFRLIMAPFRVFMHLMSIEEQLLALQNAYDHLEPGGKFVFDAFVPRLDIIMNGIDEMKDFEEEVEPGLTVRRIVSSHSDLIRQVSHIRFRFEIEDSSGVRSQVWESDLRLFFRWELEHLMTRSPFDKWKILGDFEGNELRQGSGEFVVVGERV